MSTMGFGTQVLSDEVSGPSGYLKQPEPCCYGIVLYEPGLVLWLGDCSYVL